MTYRYMRKAWEITGYTYRADIWCPQCIQTEMFGHGIERDTNPEQMFDRVAHAMFINRQDEHSFDSDEFPKVIFSSDDDGLTCGGCYKPISDC